MTRILLPDYEWRVVINVAANTVSKPRKWPIDYPISSMATFGTVSRFDTVEEAYKLYEEYVAKGYDRT